MVDSDAIPDAIMGSVKSLGEFYLNTLMNEKDIDWIFFSPAGTLGPGKRTGRFRLGKGDLIVDGNGISHISVEITPLRWSMNWKPRNTIMNISLLDVKQILYNQIKDSNDEKGIIFFVQSLNNYSYGTD